MNIQIKSTRVEPEPKLIELAREKVGELRKYLGGKDDATQVFVELSKIVGNQQTGKIWRTEINLEWEGEQFRVESLADNLEKSIHKAYSDMGHALKNHRDRHSTLVKRGGAMIKSFLRGFDR